MSRIVEITNNLNNKTGDTEERLDFNDMYNSFKINLQLNSAYEISFTATYTQQYKDAYNMLKMGQGIWYDGREYYITQLENGFDENGLATKQVTAHAILIDLMKNVRLDPKQPTEDSPEVSGDSSSDSGNDSSSDDNPQPGTVVKKSDEQQTYSLQELLDKFLKDNDQGIRYELHGNFPKQAIECSGSLYEWLGNNLASFGAYYIPHNYVLKIYDLDAFKLPTDVQLRYLHNVTSVDIQSDGNEFYNDFDVYGGKMEKDITTAGSGNGVSEAVNGDWTPVIQNAASLVGEHLSQADINLVLAQINLESGGKEDGIQMRRQVILPKDCCSLLTVHLITTVGHRIPTSCTALTRSLLCLISLIGAIKLLVIPVGHHMEHQFLNHLFKHNLQHLLQRQELMTLLAFVVLLLARFHIFGVGQLLQVGTVQVLFAMC